MEYVINDELLESLISNMALSLGQVKDLEEALETILPTLNTFEASIAQIKLLPDGTWRSSISWDDPDMTVARMDDDLVKSLIKLARVCYMMFIHPCE